MGVRYHKPQDGITGNMAKKRIIVKPKGKAEKGRTGGASGAAPREPVIVQGIWGVAYLAIAALLLLAMLFYSPKQHGGGAETHLLGPYLGTALALGMFYLFGRLSAVAFAVGVGYIGLTKLKNKPMPVKLLLWCALLAIELCVLLAVGQMPQLSAANGFWGVMDKTGVNFAGMAIVNLLVPIFKGRVFGPYFIVLIVIAITVMVGLRVKPQSVFAVLSGLFADFVSWIKMVISDIKAGIEKSPDIRPETVKEKPAKTSKKEKDNDAETPAVNTAVDATVNTVDTEGQNAPPQDQAVSSDKTIQVDDGATQSDKAIDSDNVDTAINTDEKSPEVLTPEEEAKRRLEEELSEFRRKKSEPIKILSVETPEVEPAVEEELEEIAPIIPSKRPLIVDADPDESVDIDTDAINTDIDIGIDTDKDVVDTDNNAGGGFKVTEPVKPSKPYVVPSPDIIPDPPPLTDMVDEETIYRNSAILEKTLMNFGVEGKVIFVSPGPVVTRYEIELAPGVKVSKVVNLHDDISMAVSGQKIRIQAPIPGKSAVGIELPNPKRQTVYFKNVLQSDAFKKSTADIPVVIGTNISGAPYVTDIAKMPHVLIAGQTGAGKSVCINSLVCSMLMTKKPEELRLIMIDPKKVELACYSDIPHLLAPVVTEPKEAVKALQWGVQEMERRYRVLAKVGAKKLETFNERFDAGKLNGVLDEEDNKRLPFIVIIVDELADLMMTASKDVESQIQRIAQLARAVGIHLIVATQRPSVDIITGKIKANLASRIAFRTIQSVDSKTILGYVGAEKLLGMGDMLFLRNGATDIERFHGSFISEEDVEKITEDIRSQQVSVDKIECFGDIIGDDENGDGGDDDGGHDDGKRDKLFAEAAQMVVSIGQGSTSLLQRRLEIGFARAGRLMDQLERAGVVGPANKSKVREVLMRPEDLADII
ncbi:cell division protein FtsK/SpoIIIE [Fibrobacteres bacterium R8-0-B4]